MTDGAAPFAAFAVTLGEIAALPGRLDKADRLGAFFLRATLLIERKSLLPHE